MKEAKNNEIDLMLRSLARGQSASAGHSLEDGASPSRLGQQHLDADELNSYAENALPAAARALYTEHLADCSKCRRVAAQLSLASGATLHPSVVDTVKPSSLRGFLASIVSAPVLRYLVPAFALVAIMAVALVINRQHLPRPDLVAKNEPAATTSLQENQKAARVSDASATTPEKKAADSDRVPQDSVQTKKTVAQGREQVKAEDKPGFDDSPKAAKEQVREESSSKGAAQPATAPYAAEPVSPKEQASSVVSENRDLAKEKKQPEVADQPGGKNEADQTRKQGEVAASRPAPKKVERSPAWGAGIQGIGSTDSERRARPEKGNKDEGESRLVAGHRFRKEGSVWVDVAYDSSRPTVTLARGSEQYRALVADEPAIQTIAEQLDGQIIIDWKGRTYKIR